MLNCVLGRCLADRRTPGGIEDESLQCIRQSRWCRVVEQYPGSIGDHDSGAFNRTRSDNRNTGRSCLRVQADRALPRRSGR